MSQTRSLRSSSRKKILVQDSAQDASKSIKALFPVTDVLVNAVQKPMKRKVRRADHFIDFDDEIKLEKPKQTKTTRADTSDTDICSDEEQNVNKSLKVKTPNLPAIQLDDYDNFEEKELKGSKVKTTQKHSKVKKKSKHSESDDSHGFEDNKENITQSSLKTSKKKSSEFLIYPEKISGECVPNSDKILNCGNQDYNVLSSEILLCRKSQKQFVNNEKHLNQEDRMEENEVSNGESSNSKREFKIQPKKISRSEFSFKSKCGERSREPNVNIEPEHETFKTDDLNLVINDQSEENSVSNEESKITKCNVEFGPEKDINISNNKMKRFSVGTCIMDNEPRCVKKEKRRYTTFNTIEARRNIQIENIREELPNEQNIENGDANDVFKPRRSRKRWSDELRKSMSLFDLSGNFKNNSKLVTFSETNEFEEISDETNKSRCSTVIPDQADRSVQSESISEEQLKEQIIENVSVNDTFKPRRSRKRWSDELRKSMSVMDLASNFKNNSKFVTFGETNEFIEVSGETYKSRRSKSLTDTSDRRSSRIKNYRGTPHVRKSRKCTPADSQKEDESIAVSGDLISPENFHQLEVNGSFRSTPGPRTAENNSMNSRISMTLIRGNTFSIDKSTTQIVPSRSNIPSGERRSRPLNKKKSDSLGKSTSFESIPKADNVNDYLESERIDEFERVDQDSDKKSTEFTEHTPSKMRSNVLTTDKEEVYLPEKFSTDFKQSRISQKSSPKTPNNSKVFSALSRSNTFSIDKNSTEIRPSTSNSRTSKRRSRSLNKVKEVRLRKSTSFETTPKVGNSNNSFESERDVDFERTNQDESLYKLTELSSSKIDANNAGLMKRRNTYDLEASVHDVSILKTLTENSPLEPGVAFLEDNDQSYHDKFQHITKRKKLSKGDKIGQGLDESNGTNSTKKVSFRKPAVLRKSVSLDQNIFSPPSSSSTPKCLPPKSTLLKQVLERDTKLNSFRQRRSRSYDETYKRVSRIKMPNFAKIHQKAINKMEGIQQMAERKAERARLLMSGQKPTDNYSASHSNRTVEDKNSEKKKMQKQLDFDKLPSSNSNGSLLRVVPKKDQLKIIQGTIENRLKLTTKINSPLPKVRHKNEPGPSKTVTTQYGFKVKNLEAPENKEQQIKAIATKTKVQQNDREDRRNVLKGVRSNRRFELLMKMRKDKP